MRGTIRSPIAIAAGALAMLLLAAADDEGAANGQTFGEAVDVRVVNVDVYVTDRRGRPIEDLTREDFLLYEDGDPVEITNFYAGSSAQAPADATPQRLEPGDGEPLAPLAADPPLWAVLYLDDFNLDPVDRRRVIDDLQAFATARTGEDVRFLLATHDLGLRVRTGFTRDPSVLVAAIAQAGEGSPVGVQERVEYRSLLSSLQDLISLYTDVPQCPDPCVCAWDQMIATWKTYGQSASGRIGVSLNGLGELISSLGGLPGRKALFYVSSGLMQRPGLGVLNYLGDLCPHLEQNTTREMWSFDETSRLEELTARANANRVTLYPIDGGGLRRNESGSVEYSTARFRPSHLTSQLRTANLQGSLTLLADETGGRAILNANAPLDELEELASDFASFYSLGFTPAREPDGETHHLEVELTGKRRNLELRFRRSYRDKPLAERLGDRLMATLRFGVEVNPLAVTATAGIGRSVEDGLFEVPIVLRIPPRALVTAGDEAGGRVRVFLAAEDERGGRTPLKETFLELGAQEVKTGHEMVVSVRLRDGPHRLAVGVRDELGSETSLVSIRVDPSTEPMPSESAPTGSTKR